MENQEFSQAVPSIHLLKHQLQQEQQLFDSIKKANGCFSELKEVHLRIKQLEEHLQLLDGKNRN